LDFTRAEPPFSPIDPSANPSSLHSVSFRPVEGAKEQKEKLIRDTVKGGNAEQAVSGYQQ